MHYLPELKMVGNKLTPSLAFKVDQHGGIGCEQYEDQPFSRSIFNATHKSDAGDNATLL